MKSLLIAIMAIAGLTASANAFNEAGCARVGQDLKMKIAEVEGKIKKEKDATKKHNLTMEVDGLKKKHEEAKKDLEAKKYKECVAIKVK